MATYVYICGYCRSKKKKKNDDIRATQRKSYKIFKVYSYVGASCSAFVFHFLGLLFLSCLCAVSITLDNITTFVYFLSFPFC